MRVKTLHFSYPTLDEQIGIAPHQNPALFPNRLEACYTTTSVQAEKITTPALLVKTFRGERIQQASNDEPANVLLDRIHTKQGI